MEHIHATVYDENGQFHTGIRCLRHDELTQDEQDQAHFSIRKENQVVTSRSVVTK